MDLSIVRILANIILLFASLFAIYDATVVRPGDAGARLRQLINKGVLIISNEKAIEMDSSFVPGRRLTGISRYVAATHIRTELVLGIVGFMGATLNILMPRKMKRDQRKSKSQDGGESDVFGELG